MKKIFAIFLAGFISLTVNLQAQRKQYYTMSWDAATPMGGFSDFISETSLRGGSFSGNIFFTDAVSLGFKFGYNSFHENIPLQTYYLNLGNAITAASYNYMTNSPFSIGPYYHFNLGVVEPYVGLGIGVNYILEKSFIQDISIYDDQWAFMMSPEIGLRVPFGAESNLAAVFKISYNVNFNEYQNIGVKYDNLQTLNAGLGLSWTIW